MGKVLRKKINDKSHFYLIDGSGFIFRAFYAIPLLSRKSDGLPVNAVSGFCNMIDKLLQSLEGADKPSHLGVIFDAGSQSFRNEIYPEYKANRGEPPDELIPQFPLIREATRAFNLPSIEMKGFEADDLIATYARQAEKLGARVTIISSDKDLMQLVSGAIRMVDTMKDREIRREQVLEKFQVPPELVTHVQALAGDSVDNIPGVPGIGPKIAAELINQYGSLEKLLENAEKIPQQKRRENLIQYAENAHLSMKLVQLDENVPVRVPLEDMELAAAQPEKLLKFLHEMEFNTLSKRIAQRFGVDVEISNTNSGSGGGKEKKSSAAKKVPPAIDRKHYVTIYDAASLEKWIKRAYELGQLAVDTETSSLSPLQTELVGISLGLSPNEACYIPLGHVAPSEREELQLEDVVAHEEVPPQMDRKKAVAMLKPLLEDGSILKIWQNAKFDALVLSQYDIHIAPIDDTMVMSYVLSAGAHGHGMDELSKLYLDHAPIAFKEVMGTGRGKKKSFAEIAIPEASQYAAEDADITLRLFHVLKPLLREEKLTRIYEGLDRPLIAPLIEMEQNGVKIDSLHLATLSKEFAKKMKAQEKKIFALAGEEFNLASPQQMGHILFEKLGLEGSKKTKGKALSTSASVLEELAFSGHEIAKHILDWRGLSKLKSTYTDALPSFIHPKTGRVHSSYSLTGTSTGRLSSSEPNLQNIPIRTEDGRRIREAFIPEKGRVLMSADYSQIELRLLAHIADIKALKNALHDGVDIHAMTASEIFHVPLAEMTPEIRRRAKAINFG
ncbi:MAG: DNA polymerase I, partial [Parvibaculales bacterium]